MEKEKAAVAKEIKDIIEKLNAKILEANEMKLVVRINQTPLYPYPLNSTLNCLISETIEY